LWCTRMTWSMQSTHPHYRDDSSSWRVIETRSKCPNWTDRTLPNLSLLLVSARLSWSWKMSSCGQQTKISRRDGTGHIRVQGEIIERNGLDKRNGHRIHSEFTGCTATRFELKNSVLKASDKIYAIFIDNFRWLRWKIPPTVVPSLNIWPGGMPMKETSAQSPDKIWS